jgi:hypothetical protein
MTLFGSIATLAPPWVMIQTLLHGAGKDCQPLWQEDQQHLLDTADEKGTIYSIRV